MEVLSPAQIRALADEGKVLASKRKPKPGQPDYLVWWPEGRLSGLSATGAVRLLSLQSEEGYCPLLFANSSRRGPLVEFMYQDLRSQRQAHERPLASAELLAQLKTRTARLEHSFQTVPFRDEHLNHGDQGPFLRDFGFPAAIVAKLVAWGEARSMVCTFENGNGVSSNEHCWKPEFLSDACAWHMELFGSADLTEDFVQWALEFREREAIRASHRREGDRA